MSESLFHILCAHHANFIAAALTKPLTKNDLCDLTGLSKKQLRKELAQLRQKQLIEPVGYSLTEKGKSTKEYLIEREHFRHQVYHYLGVDIDKPPFYNPAKVIH